MQIEDVMSDNKYWETIKKCSVDNRLSESEVYMCDIEKKIINFDILKEAYAKKKNSNMIPSNMMKSNDGLFIINSKYYFIEFKNGKLLSSNNRNNKSKMNEIRLKIADSSLILSDITGMSVNEMRKNVAYVLVYNGDRNNMTKRGYEVPGTGAAMLGNSLMALTGNSRYIQFGLQNYIGWLFEDVSTVTPLEFEEQYSFIGS